jgi:hypothetical protein
MRLPRCACNDGENGGPSLGYMKDSIFCLQICLVRLFSFFGSHRKKLVKNCLIAASCEAGVYRIVATGIIIKSWHQTRYQPHAVWHRHSTRVALVRCLIPRDGGSIIPYLPEAIKR